MAASRFRTTIEENARPIQSGRFRNAAISSEPASAEPESRKYKARYRRVWRHEHLFTVVEPPTVNETEESFGGWLR